MEAKTKRTRRELVQCSGLTQKGKRCLRKVTVPLGAQVRVYCRVHEHQQQRDAEAVPDSDTEVIHLREHLQQLDLSPGTLFECQCCCCEAFDHERVQCTSGEHQFCKSCLRHWVQEKIVSGSSDLSCLFSGAGGGGSSSGCAATIGLTTLERALPAKIFHAWCLKSAQENVTQAGLANLRTCPQCRSYAVVIDDDDARLLDHKLECHNVECKHRSCLRCKQPYHGKGTCLALADVSVRRFIEETLTRCRVRRCPGCDNEFVRLDGCNKMKCSRCKQLSCYACGKPIEGYEHFQADQKDDSDRCPLYTDDVAIVETALRTALAALHKRYSEEQPQHWREAVDILRQLEPKHKRLINTVFANAPVPRAVNTSSLSHEVQRLPLNLARTGTPGSKIWFKDWCIVM